MKTLWTFGDSYAESYKNKPQYLNELAKHFNIEHENYGLSGSSISYTSYKFNQVRRSIKHNDLVVIVLTNIFRHWFFKNRPRESALMVKTSPNEQFAIKQYMLYLDNELEHQTALIDFLHNVNSATKDKQLQTIVLYGFDDVRNFIQPLECDFDAIHFAVDSLDNTQRREFTEGVYETWVKTPYEKIGDSRPNHLLYSNHIILKDKLVQYFETGEKVDLTSGFVENVISMNTKNDIEFHNKEFFGNKWMFGF